ncbi:MAG: hypothetical protein A2Y65_05915 [Deltaproteobacteria bacterium RBG_13_52_11]|nr:MAG: hypothetical protein A2Y65_05915 [Deltaproteobacteria bacterium RBG_13_52_11]
MSKGGVVLVTGASHGIGKAIAALLVEKGFRVYGTSRRPSGEQGNGLKMLQLDITSDQSVESCVSGLIEKEGRIDVLINNAAVGLLGAIEETTIEEGKALFEANFFGTARMVNAVLPGMRQRRSGLIINFGSLAATLPIPFHAYLSCSKAAVNTFTDALRLEVKHLNIGVCVVEPGMVATHRGEEFAQLRVKKAISDYAEPEQRAFAVIEKGQSVGGDPQPVAETVLRIIRSKAPARYYLVGVEKRYVLLSRFLPQSAIEFLVSRHFRLTK